MKPLNNKKKSILLPLMEPNFGSVEINEAVKSLKTSNVTMGKKVNHFEHDFSSYTKIKYSTMVNSGSSANLLGLSILSNPLIPNKIKKGDEIIVPAVTWSTTIFPIINIGAKPVLVDVDSDYLLDTTKCTDMINHKTKAIIPVHLLGNVCDMDIIKQISRDNKLFIMEDCCEALGSEFKGVKVGNFSDVSTFSFYFSHHITTIEGGMMCTNDIKIADLSRILRAHGYARHSYYKQEYEKQYPNIDPRFLFVNIGYNFRPTEIQGAFGIHQIKKIDTYIKRRSTIANEIKNNLQRYAEYLELPRQKKNTRHSWFVFPITVIDNEYFDKKMLTQFLENYGVETRPIVCGNFEEQPVMKLFKHRKGDLSNARKIMNNSFYFGIHPSINKTKIYKLLRIFEYFFQKIKR